jgi:hypothetical protein
MPLTKIEKNRFFFNWCLCQKLKKMYFFQFLAKAPIVSIFGKKDVCFHPTLWNEKGLVELFFVTKYH